MKTIETYGLVGQGSFSECADLMAEAIAEGYKTHFEGRYTDSDGIVYGDLYAATPEWVAQYKQNGGLWY